MHTFILRALVDLVILALVLRKVTGLIFLKLFILNSIIIEFGILLGIKLCFFHEANFPCNYLIFPGFTL